MEKIIFENRDTKGKKNKILLKEGKTPAVVYNAKGESKNIMIGSSLAGKIAREVTSTTILDAEMGSKGLKVVVKEIDMNPITEEIRHIAFFEIDESKEMAFTIPFKIIGISPAVKNNLGILVEVMNSIDVRCKVSDLIPFIEIDISKLEHPGQSISVEDLNISKSISLVNEELMHATIVTVTELLEEEVFETPVVEETAEAGATEEGAGDQEVPEEVKE
ncbi:MAG: 50S ribosomal protein L25 [Candidatus Dojkabacteria bacterium]